VLEGTPQLPWYRPRLDYLAYALWILFALIIAARVIFRRDEWNGVYTEFHRAALGWLDRKDIYTPGLEFRYPPIAVLFIVPFSLLGEVPGSVLWRWLNVAVYVGSMLWAFRVMFPSEMKHRAQGGILLLLLPLSITSLNNAQVNGLVIGCLIACAVALREERFRLAAFLAMVPVAFKVYPVVFAMVVALVYPRRFVPWFLLFAVIAALLPYAFADPSYVSSQYRQLYDAVRLDDRTDDITRAYRDLRLIFALGGAPMSDRLYHVIQVLAGAGIAAVVFFGKRRAWSADRTWGYALALVCCWMTLLGPATEKATYILLAPILVWLMIEAVRDRERGRLWLLLAIYALYLLPVFTWRSAYRSAPVRIALPLATVPLLAYIALRAVRDLRATPPCSRGVGTPAA